MTWAHKLEHIYRRNISNNFVSHLRTSRNDLYKALERVSHCQRRSFRVGRPTDWNGRTSLSDRSSPPNPRIGERTRVSADLEPIAPAPKVHILYKGHGLIAINKPAGLVMQADHREEEADDGDKSKLTLNEVFRQIMDAFPEQRDPPLSVHRLDKVVTGLCLFATNHRHAKALAAAFARKGPENLTKTYLAIVHGDVKGITGHESGSITARLQPNRETGITEVLDNGSDEAGREALTLWEFGGYSPTERSSLLRLRLVTGVKHQLRAHLSHVLRTPILHDYKYSLSSCSTPYQERSIFLHSSTTSLWRYREDGKRFRLRITAPLPDDFTEYCRRAGLELTEEDIRGGSFRDDGRATGFIDHKGSGVAKDEAR